MDPDVPVHAAKEVISQVLSVPAGPRCSQALAQLVKRGLGNQSEAHVALADISIEGAGPLPAQGLMDIEELFDVPELGEMQGEIVNFGGVAGAQKRLVIERVGRFSGALDDLKVGTGVGVLGLIGQFERCRMLVPPSLATTKQLTSLTLAALLNGGTRERQPVSNTGSGTTWNCWHISITPFQALRTVPGTHAAACCSPGRHEETIG